MNGDTSGLRADFGLKAPQSQPNRTVWITKVDSKHMVAFIEYS